MWDGSWLTGTFVKQWEHDHKKFALIKITSTPNVDIKEKEIYGQYKKLDDSLAIIIDEIAPLFHIEKRGTHRITIGTIKYILYKVELLDNIIISETSLSSTLNTDPLRKDPDVLREIRKQIVFQDLISINRIGESHIILRLNPMDSDGTFKYIVLGSYTDKKDLNDKVSLTWSNISASLRQKYFNEQNSIDVVLKSMINKDELFELNYEIEQVIKRINREYLWFANFIINRIRRYF